MAGMRAQVPERALAAMVRGALALACAGLCECTAPAASPGKDVVGTGDGIAAEDVVDAGGTADAVGDALVNDVPDGASTPEVADASTVKDVLDVASTPDVADDATGKDVPDVAGAPDVVDAAEVADPGDGFDADVACPPHRVPLVKGGVVVDPCGCCEIAPDCTGYFGGSPSGNQCSETYDAAPPCYESYDSKGCKVLYCSGSCLSGPPMDVVVDSGD
ncbi:MAG: hypothetical protein HY902_12710 [Deltaproteobacteria bacterium]|nr:hypothetical protein [Deltaproteobacteria bacterium]